MDDASDVTGDGASPRREAGDGVDANTSSTTELSLGVVAPHPARWLCWLAGVRIAASCSSSMLLAAERA
jgi:hypothetical protein